MNFTDTAPHTPLRRPQASYFTAPKRNKGAETPGPFTPGTPQEMSRGFFVADSYTPLTPGTPGTPSEQSGLIDRGSVDVSSLKQSLRQPGQKEESKGSRFGWFRPSGDTFTLGRPPQRRRRQPFKASVDTTAPVDEKIDEASSYTALSDRTSSESATTAESDAPTFLVTDPAGGEVKFDTYVETNSTSSTDEGEVAAAHTRTLYSEEIARPSPATSVDIMTPMTPITPPLTEESMDEIIIEEVIEEELPVEEAPRVAPLFEVVDPQIPQVAPEPVINHIPDTVTSHITHPWTVPPFNIVDRDQPRIRPILATIKVSLSLAVVFSLMVGYGLRLKIVSFGAYSFGMYGLLLIIDFIVQASAATYNRHRVNRLTKKSPITKGVDMLHARNELPTVAPSALPEVSIAVVGYREDEEAWQACLKSLREQEYPVKHIIGVVDGNDKPDCDMAEAFTAAFPENERTVVHLPVLLSVLYKQKYWETIEALGVAPPTKWQRFRMWFTQEPRAGQDVAHEVAWNHMLNYLHERATAERWADWKALCFTEPHGHKRHAMFTAFVVGAYVLGTKDAMLTTDSDTLVHKKAVTNLMALLFSSPKLAGVTGDVRIWNKKESFLARMSALRYWFAFNVERACQSGFGCVGCLSGPLGLYKVSDMMTILGPWILQSFLGKETTFGDDRHLTNRILSLGHKTGYTHLAVCDSDTPAGYVRWVKQQTRWSKSFFREAFWFPKSFAYHDFWLTVETTKQFLYPMILTATVLQMLYKPGDLIRPAIWLGTMFGVATIKSLYGVIAEGDLYYMLFGAYGFMYFFGLLPSKLFACFTVGITTWGTSARSKSEFTRPESFYSRTTHIGHLVVWYLALTVGLGFFFASRLSTPLFFLIALVGLFPVLHVYSDVIIGETRYAFFMLKKWRQARRSAQDVDENVTSKFRIIRTRRRRVKVPAPKVMDFVVEPEKFATPAPFPEENPFADVNIVDPPIFRTSEDSNSASTNSTLASDSTHTAFSASGSNASTASVDVAAPTDGDKDAVKTHAGKFGLPALDTVNVPAVLRKDVSGLPVLKKHKSVEETRIESMEDDGKLSDSTSESGYFLSRASSMGDLGADRASIASSQMNSPFLTPLTEFPTRIPGSSKSGKRSFSKLAIMRSRPKETAKTPLAVS